jgi:hypothetical protein
MAGKRKSFLDYAAAQAIVAALALTSMQDWIAYSKGKDPQGRTRPDNIPSNPWTVYKTELADQGKKFSINEFIGCKLARKPRAKKTDGAPKSTRKPKNVADANVADTDVADTVVQTPFEIARAAVQALQLPNRDAFNNLKRDNMLPAGIPRNPDSTFKAEWQGWGDFLGNGNKQVTKTAEA